MARVRTRNRRRERLRSARKKVAALARPGAQRLAMGLKRLNKDYAIVRQAAAAGYRSPSIIAQRAAVLTHD